MFIYNYAVDFSETAGRITPKLKLTPKVVLFLGPVRPSTIRFGLKAAGSAGSAGSGSAAAGALNSHTGSHGSTQAHTGSHSSVHWKLENWTSADFHKIAPAPPPVTLSPI